MKALEFLKEDDYWGDRPDPQGDARREEERKDAILDACRNVVDWEDRVHWHRDEIHYSTPKPKGKGQVIQPQHKREMTQEMREMGETMIEEIRIKFEEEYEIVALGPYSVTLGAAVAID